VQFIHTVLSLCYEQQLPAKPLVQRSRPDFRTTSWMLLCLRELHHNLRWKIILITLSSPGNTHRYVVLQRFLRKPGLSLGALVAGVLAEICWDIPPPRDACCFSLCTLNPLLGTRGLTALHAVEQHCPTSRTSSAVPRLSCN